MRIIFTSLFLLSVFFSKATIHYVAVENNRFNPSTFVMNLGDSVLWTWSAGSHTTTSTAIPSGATPWFESMDISNTAFLYIPAVSGAYNYECYFHSANGMIADFTVNDPLSVPINEGNKTIRLRSSRVNEYLTVEMPELQQEVIPIVRDLTGRVVQTFDAIPPGTNTLYVGNLKNGIYLLELASLRMNISYRFIKY